MKDFRTQFRLPLPLAEKLKAAAAENHRSLNAEIVDRLEASFDGDGDSLGTITLMSGDREIEVKASKAELARWLTKGAK